MTGKGRSAGAGLRPSRGTRPAAHSRRALLRSSLAGAGAFLAACTLDRVDRELPPVTVPPFEVVQPPPLPPQMPEAAAGSSATTTSAPGAPQAATASIGFEAWGPRILLDAFRGIEDEFHRQAPWITVEARLDNALSSDSLRTRLRNGDEPDVSRIAPEDVFDFTAAGLLHGLGARISIDSELQDEAPGSATSRTGAGGEQTALSVGAAHQCVFYHEEHLETAGVAAPTSWNRTWNIEEFEEAARRLVVADGDRIERFGLTAIPAYVRPVLAESGDGGFLDDSQHASSLATPTRLERLQRLTTWPTGLAIELPISYRFIAPFSGGLSSMHIDRSDVGRWVRAGVPWAVAPLPAWDNRQVLTEAEELCVGIPAQSRAGCGLDLRSLPAWPFSAAGVGPNQPADPSSAGDAGGSVLSQPQHTPVQPRTAHRGGDPNHAQPRPSGGQGMARVDRRRECAGSTGRCGPGGIPGDGRRADYAATPTAQLVGLGRPSRLPPASAIRQPVPGGAGGAWGLVRLLRSQQT